MTPRQQARRQRANVERQSGYNYAGFGVCKCGAFAYLVGKTYEGKKCRECAGA